MNHWSTSPQLTAVKNASIVKTAPAYLLLVPEVLKREDAADGETYVSDSEFTWHNVGIGEADLGTYWPPLLERLAEVLRERYGAGGPAPTTTGEEG